MLRSRKKSDSYEDLTNMKYLITGASGFVGEYLAEELCNRKQTIIACARHSTPVLESLNNITIIYPDITIEKQISQVIIDSAPDVIFHLAAQSFPRVSWENPVRTMEINLLGTLYILEAMRKMKKIPTLVILGSSAEYAENFEGIPIKEDDELYPSSIYGVSKLAAMKSLAYMHLVITFRLSELGLSF